MATLAGLKCPYCLVHGVTSHLGSNGVCGRCWRKSEGEASQVHTPGPWTAEMHADGAFEIRALQQSGDEMVPPYMVVARRGGLRHAPAVSAANALLIAAAPDLLAACKSIAAMAVSWQPLSNGDIGDVRAAIAKAEGS